MYALTLAQDVLGWVQVRGNVCFCSANVVVLLVRDPK